jgi:hypothetical protein
LAGRVFALIRDKLRALVVTVGLPFFAHFEEGSVLAGRLFGTSCGAGAKSPSVAVGFCGEICDNVRGSSERLGRGSGRSSAGWVGGVLGPLRVPCLSPSDKELLVGGKSLNLNEPCV